VPPVGDEVEFNPESKLSEADLTKLLESSRSEIRSYQALYISLLAFSVASITVLTKLPGWDPSPAPFKLAILLIWICGIVTLVVGVYLIVPRFTPRSKRVTDLQVLIHLDRALTETDQNSAKASLGKAVRVTFRIQRQVADAKVHFKRGVALVLIALIAMAIWSAFVRERSVSRETQQPEPNRSSGRTTNK
jgi:cytochrome c-type biogenesis protein CcmH/NrfF